MIDLIEDLPNTDNMFGRKVDLKSREDVMFNLYARPTIPFKLICESSSSRKELVSAISSTVEIIDTNYIEITAGAFYFTLLILVISCFTLGFYNLIVALCIRNPDMSEKAGDILNTVFICVHSTIMCGLVLRMSMPFRMYPGQQE